MGGVGEGGLKGMMEDLVNGEATSSGWGDLKEVGVMGE